VQAEIAWELRRLAKPGNVMSFGVLCTHKKKLMEFLKSCCWKTTVRKNTHDTSKSEEDVFLYFFSLGDVLIPSMLSHYKSRISHCLRRGTRRGDGCHNFQAISVQEFICNEKQKPTS
jgi:hypothetical protein